MSFMFQSKRQTKCRFHFFKGTNAEQRQSDTNVKTAYKILVCYTEIKLRSHFVK